MRTLVLLLDEIKIIMKSNELLDLIKSNLAILEAEGEIVLTSAIPDKAANMLCEKLSPYFSGELSAEEITGVRGAINEVINGFGLYDSPEGEMRIGVSKEVLKTISEKLRNAI